MALLRPCATSAGFTATPEAQRRLDMGALKAALLERGYKVLVDARIILVVRPPADRLQVESSLYDTGRVLLKTTDREAAEAAYGDLEAHLAASAR